jgi:hypothetical protein
MNEVRKFRIIIDSKELCICSGSSPSSVAKKAVKKLCEGSKKIVKFSLKECKHDCKKVYGPYQGHMEKLDKPYKRNGKTITHRVVCEKFQIKKMKGGRDLVFNDFKVIDSSQPFRSVIHKKKLFLKKQWVFFDIISGISGNENNASRASTKNENSEQNNVTNIPQFYQYVVIKDTSKNITFKKHEIISGNEDHSIEPIEITDIEISVLIELYINILESITKEEQPTNFSTTIRKTLEKFFIDKLNHDQLEELYENITEFCELNNPICSEFLEKIVSKRNRNQRKQRNNDFQLSSDEIQYSNNFRIVFLEEENQYHIFFHTIELNGKQFYKYKVIIDSNNNITFREIFENEELILVKKINIGEIEYDALFILKEIQDKQDPINKNKKFKELIDDMIEIWNNFEVTNKSNIKMKKIDSLFGNKNKYYIFFHNVSGYYQYVLIKHSDKKFTVKKMNVKEISSNEELRTFLDIDIGTIHSDILEKLHLDILHSHQFQQNQSFATTIRDELSIYTEGHKETELTFEDFKKKEEHSNCNVKFYGKYIFFHLLDDSFYEYALFLDSGDNLYLKKVRRLADGTYIIVDITSDNRRIFQENSTIFENLYNDIIKCKASYIKNKIEIDIKIINNIIEKLVKYFLGNKELGNKHFLVTIEKGKKIENIYIYRQISSRMFNKNYSLFFDKNIYVYFDNSYIFNFSNDDTTEYYYFNYLVIIENKKFIFKKVNDVSKITRIITISDIDMDDIPISILYELLINIKKRIDKSDFSTEEDNYKTKIFELYTKLESYLDPYIEYKIWVESILQGKIKETNNGKKKITVTSSLTMDNKQQINIDYEGIFSFDFINKYMEINNSISKEKKEEWLDHILKNKKIKKKNGTKFSFMPRINSIANSIKKYNAKKKFTNSQIQELIITN